MAVRSVAEIMETMRTVLGDQTADTALTALEDISDTLNDYETRLSDSTDWKQKFETNDAEWRQKYRDRFYSGEPIKPPASGQPTLSDEDSEPDEPKLKTTFESLFEPVTK